MDHHRAGPLKQRNKPHKVSGKKSWTSSRNRKNSLCSVNSGSSSLISSKSGSSVSRIVRKNQLLQARKLKREELLNARRGIAVAPILVSVLSFGDGDSGNNGKKLLELLQQLDQSSSATVTISKRNSARGCLHVDMPKFRTKYQLVLLDKHDINGSLDLVKISDVFLVLFNSDTVDNYIDRLNNDPYFRSDEFILFDAIYNHCLPPTLYAINGGVNDNRIKRLIQELVEKSFSATLDNGSNSGLKLRSLDTVSDLLQMFHHLSNLKRKPNSYCARRSQLFAEQIEFIPGSSESSEPEQQFGTLIVDGYVRNSSLNVNSVVYIPEFGEFLMEQIEAVPDPYAASKTNRSIINYCIRADPEQQQSMIRENKVETIFEEELREMEADMNEDHDFEDQNPKNGQSSQKEKVVLEKKKVPKGTSEYQAAWIFESDNDDDDADEDNDDLEDSEDDDQMMIIATDDDIVSKSKKSVHFAPTEQVFEDEDFVRPEVADEEVADNRDNDDTSMKMDYDDEMNMAEERETLEKFKESRLYEQFPDEIDTPTDRLARERFSKFRGLKSFRTSGWDREESLPADYSRIFQFDNFSRTRHRLFKTDPIGADPGFYIRVTIRNVPKQLYDYYRQHQRPLVLFELLAHEHKMSVLNLVLKKVPTFSEPIRSKEKLIIHLGCRRFESRPVFSSHSIGDKHKFERFLRSDVACVATIYAPITFPPASVLVYKQFSDDGSTQPNQLVATGSLLNCSPDRLIIKRLILSGHPFKINKKHAVVRYMFFNRDDILWFRPIELRTKYGRKGHIQEPLGTHGHMKCIFDRQLSSQDTVLMSLYRRVFPKWYYQPTVPTTINIASTTTNGNSEPLGSTMMEP